MPVTKKVALLSPIEHHNETITHVELREPTGGLYAQLGEPRIAVANRDGAYWVEQPEVIKRYLDKMIVHQDGAVLLSLMSLPDVMMLKEELFDFFGAAAGTITARRAASLSST